MPRYYYAPSGLFEVVVGGRVSDVLGLADVVFPSMLAGWSLRYDIAKRKSFETEKENSKKIIETSLIQNFVEENEYENDGEIENVVKLSLFDRVRNIFRVDKIVPRQITREVSKEKQRDRNIRIIIEEEKIENLDRKLELDLRSSVFSSSLIGYGLGCFLCELFQTGEGQPALLFIVPSMLITVFITGLIRGEITEMWSYSPKIEEN
jgi:Signal peptide peptidase